MYPWKLLQCLWILVSHSASGLPHRSLTNNFHSGSTSEFCGAGCVSGYGADCDSYSITDAWQTAVANSITDEEAGGEYYWDADKNLFWTWDTPEMINRKFTEIVAELGLGGVFAWSLGQDSYDWEHIVAIRDGVKGLEGNATTCAFEAKKRTYSSY